MTLTRTAPETSPIAGIARHAGVVFPGLDHLVVTAANAAQAEGYRLQLRSREMAGDFGAARVHVIADPEGRRIGSGGATIQVLVHLLAQLPASDSAAEAFSGRRIVVLHAGGDSRRLPAYAAHGKLFAPLPCARPDGQPAALFDLLISNLLRTPAPPEGQVLLAAGDVLLTFDPSEVDWDRPGVTGVAFADSPDRAARHGVYVTDPAGAVVDFLQKPDREALDGHAALDPLGRALIDTGLMSFSPAAAARLCEAAGARYTSGRPQRGPGLLADLLAGDAAEVDLYEEIALALARRVGPADYAERVLTLPRNQSEAQRAPLNRLYEALRPVAFHCCTLSYCDFFHLGTSRELLAGLLGRSRTSATYGFRNRAFAAVPDSFPTDGVVAFNSAITTESADWGEATVVESSYISSPVALSRRNVLTGLPRELARPVELPEGVGVTILPRGPAEFAAVGYGIDDDFRSRLGDASATLFGRSFAGLLSERDLGAEHLWPARTALSLYTARLWCVGTADDAWDGLIWLLTGRGIGRAAWIDRPRASIAELVSTADHARMLEQRSDLQRIGSLRRPLDRLVAESDLPAAALADRLRTPIETAEFLEALVPVTTHRDHGLRARAMVLAQLARQRAAHLGMDAAAASRMDAAVTRLAGDAGTASLARAATAEVAAAVATVVAQPTRPPRAAIEQDQVVWATAPARLDFAGGWSDTPPICSDRGGTVVNAAVTLNGQYPIQAIAKLAAEPVVTLTSIDLGSRLVIDRIDQLVDHSDPGRWDSLPKACLCLAGFAGGQSGGDLREILQGFGGGIDLTVFSALPKGSGLGTSSILGATVLACLARLTGSAQTAEQIVERTSVAEQMLTTGGGWQDQVGGIYPGVKLVRTQPGPAQVPTLAWLAFDSALARSHLLLYFTGMKRLAKNILQNVVHRYLARDPEQLAIIEALKAGALDLRAAIDARDLDGFGRGVRQYWDLKKRIDPGSTTPAVERLAARVQRDCLGYSLLGAGGGGFMFMVARDEAAARRIRDDLIAAPAAPGARFFDFAIDDQGLKVCVL